MGFNMVAIAFLLAASVFVFSVIVYRFSLKLHCSMNRNLKRTLRQIWLIFLFLLTLLVCLFLLSE